MNQHQLEQLLKDHHQDAFKWARQCCMYNSDDAREVIQIVYLKIFEGKAKFGGRSSFKTWLFSVIRFTAIDFAKQKPSYDTLDHLQLVEQEPEDANDINYKKLLSKLSDRQQQVLLLSFYHGMTLAEVADITDLHIGTVRTHYERGKEALRTLIQRQVYE